MALLNDIAVRNKAGDVLDVQQGAPALANIVHVTGTLNSGNASDVVFTNQTGRLKVHSFSIYGAGDLNAVVELIVEATTTIALLRNAPVGAFIQSQTILELDLTTDDATVECAGLAGNINYDIIYSITP